MALGAEQRGITCPTSEPWLVERLADAAEGAGRDALVVGVDGWTRGCRSLRAGRRPGGHERPPRAGTTLIDLDPLGGGIDLVLGAEDCPGLRWPDFADTRGRLASAALRDALPERHGLTVLSWGRGHVVTIPPPAVRAVVSAARRGGDAVVLDMPRWLDAATEEALELCTCTLLVVPAEVRAVAAAARVALGLTAVAADVRVVVRGPSPSGLGAVEVSDALGLPVVAEMDSEPHLDDRLDRGEPPAQTGRGTIAAACDEVLDDLVTATGVWAA